MFRSTLTHFNKKHSFKQALNVYETGWYKSKSEKALEQRLKNVVHSSDEMIKNTQYELALQIQRRRLNQTVINQTTKLSQNEEKGKFDEENFFKGGKGETVIYKEDKNRSKLAHLIDDNPRNYNPKNETYSRIKASADIFIYNNDDRRSFERHVVRTNKPSEKVWAVFGYSKVMELARFGNWVQYIYFTRESRKILLKFFPQVWLKKCKIKIVEVDSPTVRKYLFRRKMTAIEEKSFCWAVVQKNSEKNRKRNEALPLTSLKIRPNVNLIIDNSVKSGDLPSIYQTAALSGVCDVTTINRKAMNANKMSSEDSHPLNDDFNKDGVTYNDLYQNKIELDSVNFSPWLVNMYSDSIFGMKDCPWNYSVKENTICLIAISSRTVKTTATKPKKSGAGYSEPTNTDDLISEASTPDYVKKIQAEILKKTSFEKTVQKCHISEIPWAEIRESLKDGGKRNRLAVFVVGSSDFIHPEIVSLASRNRLSRAVHLYNRVETSSSQCANALLFDMRKNLKKFGQKEVEKARLKVDKKLKMLVKGEAKVEDLEQLESGFENQFLDKYGEKKIKEANKVSKNISKLEVVNKYLNSPKTAKFDVNNSIRKSSK